jgi:small conductance mechanosensitive channel
MVMLPIFPAVAQAEGTVEVTQEKLDNLIQTLESEVSRQEFIDNLKALNEAEQAQSEGVSLDLGLDTWTNDMIKVYEDFLDRHGFNEDIFGKSMTTALIFLLGFLFLWLVKKLSHSLRDKLNALRDYYNLCHDRFRLYARWIRYSGYVIVTLFTIYSLSIVWDVTNVSFLMGEGKRILLANVFNIFVVVSLAILLWETLNTAIENYMQKVDGPNSARMRTLLPIAKHVLLFAFAVLFTLVVLSEIGINIVPLLAGAGVLGIAIGFGAQTMVKDFLTGFTIILEDLIQVGDVAKLGDKIGVIEKITVRKVQLRDLAGIVYTVPFSEITIIENWTKDYSYYVFDVGIAYREDVDEVIGYLKDIDEEMREDEDFKNLILEPIEILGVDKFADSAVVIKARIKTLPIKQWTVGREYNRRMKYKFDEKSVEIPFPHQTLYFGHDKQGKAPPAPVEILNESK